MVDLLIVQLLTYLRDQHLQCHLQTIQQKQENKARHLFNYSDISSASDLTDYHDV